MARTTSRSVNMPAAVLPSVRTTSLTTSALILLARINWAAMPTVSFIRTVATRAVFLRRMSPTCIATSFRSAAEARQIWYTLCQLSIRNPLVPSCAKYDQTGSNTDVLEGRCPPRTRRTHYHKGHRGSVIIPEIGETAAQKSAIVPPDERAFFRPTFSAEPVQAALDAATTLLRH